MAASRPGTSSSPSPEPTTRRRSWAKSIRRAQTVIVAAPTALDVLDPGVIDNSLGLHTETFNQVTAGAASNNGTGHGNFYSDALGATFSASGHSGVVNGSSGVTARALCRALSTVARIPTNYLSIGGGGSETITFTSEKNSFGLYWGSLNSYNSIKFYDGNTLVASYTGDQFAPLFPTGNQSSFSSNGYVQFAHLPLFDKVVLASSQNAFEIDNISAGYVPEYRTLRTGHGQAERPRCRRRRRVDGCCRRQRHVRIQRFDDDTWRHRHLGASQGRECDVRYRVEQWRNGRPALDLSAAQCRFRLHA